MPGANRQPAARIMDDDLRSFLSTIELEEHAQAFDDQGYTSLLVLRSLTKDELSEAAAAAQMLPGHVAKLRFHLQQDAGLSPVAPAPGGGTGAADNVPAGPGPAPAPPPPPQQQQPALVHAAELRVDPARFGDQRPGRAACRRAPRRQSRGTVRH